MLRDLQLRAMAVLGIALKDFLVLSKLQEIAPGVKFNLACPYFSSEELWGLYIGRRNKPAEVLGIER